MQLALWGRPGGPRRPTLAVLLLLVVLLIPAPPDGVLQPFARARADEAPLAAGIHAPNRPFNEQDYARVAEGEFATVKLMSYHPPVSYERLERTLPGLLFFVRLDTPWHELPAPEQFVATNAPRLRALVDAGYDLWIEIGNEPNLELHPRAERTFVAWYLAVLDGLRAAVPEGKYGFPGLARDLRELDWLEANAAAVEASDWLGVHTYWSDEREMLDPRRGLHFMAIHRRFPHLPVVITEAGNQADRVALAERARQYARFVRTVARLPYVRAVHFFILSGTEEWRRFFFDQVMVDAVRRASFEPLTPLERLLGAREPSRRVHDPLAERVEPGMARAALQPSPTPVLDPTPTPGPLARRQLLQDVLPGAAPALAPAPGARWARLEPDAAPAAALRTASAYTVSDLSARLVIAPPHPGVPFSVQIAETDLFTAAESGEFSRWAVPVPSSGARATGFALLWDGASWRLQYRRDGVITVDAPLAGVPEHDGWLHVEVALEPRSAAAWIWPRGTPQPPLPNVVFAPPEVAALDGARARSVFLPAHPVAEVVLEGVTRYS